jgi:hypothetical protein
MTPRTILAFLAALVFAIPGATSAASQPAWAADGTIRPGVQANSPSGQCTTNFVFYEPAGTTFNIYIGLAAHCFTLGGSTDTNGCLTGSRPLGTQTTVQRAAYPATLAYSSWLTMKAVNEQDSSTCAVNDFALVKLDPRDHANVNPTLSFFGGPVVHPHRSNGSR